VNRRQAITLFFLWPLIALSQACGDSPSSGEPGAGGGTSPAPQGPRLAWFQAGPSPAAVRAYNFILFIDGARTPFTGATCSTTPAPTGFECLAPFPTLSAGRRVLEISAADPLTGTESARSAPLTVEVGSDGRPRASLAEEPGSGPVFVATPVPPPSTVCTAGTPADCFTVSVVAGDMAPVRRLLALADGRLLVLQEDGAVTMLPSGTSERPEFVAGAGAAAVDVAADPDFPVNRFLYFATAVRTPDGRRSVSVVRVRELADRLGEPATLVADLPAAPAGNPAIAIGPDRRIYLAMPGAADDRSGYGGQLLRFTADGKAAGHARTGSPIMAQGRAQPTRLAWDAAAARLLMASVESDRAPVLFVVPAEAGSGAWPAAPVAVGRTLTSLLNARLTDMAAAPGVGAAAGGRMFAMTGGDPGVLLLATVTAATPPDVASVRAVTLGLLTPTAVAFAATGDLMVAASRESDPGAVLLRLRRIAPQRLP